MPTIPGTIAATISDVELSAAEKIFRLCVERKMAADGCIEFECKLGLWSVAGLDSYFVERDAKHYFALYLDGGEYNALLKAKGWKVE